MVKITLYNSGELKEVVFVIIFYTSFVLTVCIPNISKEPKEDVYLEYSVSMLRILPLRAKAFKRIIQQLSTIRAKAFKRIIQQLSTIYVFPYSIYFLLIIEYDGFAV